MVEIRIPGRPVPQPRTRVARNGGRYIPKGHAVHAYKQAIALLASQQFPAPIDGPVGVVILFAYGGSKSERFRTKQPDVDNLAKAVLDALKGIAWHDDAQVAWLHVVKKQMRQAETVVKVFHIGYSNSWGQQWGESREA